MRTLCAATVGLALVAGLVTAPTALAGGASIGTTPSAGASGLPDGRVYEQVSPAQKNGGFAGVNDGAEYPGYALAAASGEAVLYLDSSSPFGESDSGIDSYSVSQRTAGGWQTRSAVPEGLAHNLVDEEPKLLLPSSDFSQVVFSAVGSFAREDPSHENSSGGLFRAEVGAPGEAEWLTEPEEWSASSRNPSFPVKPLPGENEQPDAGVVVGASAGLGTVFFVYQGTLTRQDETRAANVAANGDGPAGFYEWDEGSLRPAGELPGGGPSPWGAVPAATGAAVMNKPELYDNEVAEEPGTGAMHALFVSPQPEYASQAGEPTELYLRERSPAGAARTVLVSHTEAGQPAPGSGASTAVVPMLDQEGETLPYAYAAADGSRVFFESMDDLASSAAGQAPSGAGPWMYEFDVESEKLIWLPEVSAPLYMASDDGASFMLEHREAKTVVIPADEERSERKLKELCEEAHEAEEYEEYEEAEEKYEEVSQQHGKEDCESIEAGDKSLLEQLAEERAISEGDVEELQIADGLELWSNGHLSEVATFPAASASPPLLADPPAQDGSTLVFATGAELDPGSFDNAGGLQQIYRYALPSAAQPEGELRCLSCRSAGSPPPTSGARISNDEQEESPTRPYFRGAQLLHNAVLGSRGVADEGDRVFFDTAEPLLPDAVNGQIDVYEWEQAGAGTCTSASAGGCLYLISPGTGTHPSWFLDNGASGNDVFFTSADGLVEGDTDDAYDVYDARVGGGFPAPTTTASCGACRQGSAAPSLASPLTAAPGPSGNLAPPKASKTKKTTKKRKGSQMRKHKLAKALKKCAKQPRPHRAACKRRARRRFGAKAASAGRQP